MLMLKFKRRCISDEFLSRKPLPAITKYSREIPIKAFHPQNSTGSESSKIRRVIAPHIPRMSHSELFSLRSECHYVSRWNNYCLTLLSTDVYRRVTYELDAAFILIDLFILCSNVTKIFCDTRQWVVQAIFYSIKSQTYDLYWYAVTVA